MPWFNRPAAPKVDKPAVLKEIQQQAAGIVQINSQRINWPATPTGIYGEAVAGLQSGAPDTGILVVLETNGQIAAISTTNNSFWVGSARGGLVEVSYVNQHKVSGTLRLQLAPDGTYLAGTWQTSDSSGTYKAYRTQSYDQQTIIAKLKGIPVA